MTWGNGDQGQLGRIPMRSTRRGDYMRMTMLRPTIIPGCRSIVFENAFCGSSSTFLKDASGRFFACGLNNCGQCAIPLANEIPNMDAATLEDRVDRKSVV